MITEPQEFYKKNVNINRAKVAGLKKQLLIFSSFRILVFLLTVIGIYIYYENWQVATLIGVIGMSIFIYLLSKYTDLKQQRDFHKALAKLNEEEIDIVSGNYLSREDGSEYKNPEHFYSEDIDLFGKGSFFQYLNRTQIDNAKEKLAAILLENNTSEIILKQKAIAELSQKADWRQAFSASANLIKVETSSDSVRSWIKNYQPFIKSKVRFLPIIFSIASLVVLALISLDYLSLSFLLYWIVLGLFLTGLYLKKINALSIEASKARETIRQFSVLLEYIENVRFSSELLQKKQKTIQSSNTKASKLFKTLSSALDTLDNRNNLIYALIGNGFFLTDIRNSFKVEKWIVSNKEKIKDWFEVIAFFDSYNSLGNFAFNHPHYVFPNVSKGEFVVNAKNLGHPLLNSSKRIDNDIQIKPEEFFIVTGANMAGKSTFLRTVSLHIVMANIGLPVCAEMSEYSPVKLITSMRTNDSLKDESSYFFAELTRLKFIVDEIKTEPYFIVLDEILKGTNSTDKAIGSKKFVEKLVKSNATGLIATHDLSLCEIENDLEEVKNYFFDAQIKNDELYFDYTFKKGICQNMNASFLLKKMEIV